MYSYIALLICLGSDGWMNDASPHPIAHLKQDCGWHNVRLDMASPRQGLETPGKEGPFAEVTIPTLHCPLDKSVFPTVESELRHPQLVAVAPNTTYSCYGELGSDTFVTQIPQDSVGGCQWFVTIGFHVNTRAGVCSSGQPSHSTLRCFAKLQPTAEKKPIYDQALSGKGGI